MEQEEEIKLGDIIKKHLKNKDLSQRELATKSGLTESTISCYVSDKRQPGAGNLIKMADAFGMTVDEFLGRPAPSHIVLTKDTDLLIQSGDKFIRVIKDGNNLDIRHNLRETDDSSKEILSEFYEVILQPLYEFISDNNVPLRETLLPVKFDIKDFHLSQKEDTFHIYSTNADYLLDFVITDTNANLMLMKMKQGSKPECIWRLNGDKFDKIMKKVFSATSVRSIEFLLP